MRDLKRILELRFENHSQREIARMLKVSRNTVNITDGKPIQYGKISPVDTVTKSIESVV